jgi:hypothetical protein
MDIGAHNVSIVEAACSDTAGTADIYLGKDGVMPQMSSLSRHPEILHNVTDAPIEVRTTTLADLVSGHAMPDDFGVLLVDTEGVGSDGAARARPHAKAAHYRDGRIRRD